MERSTSDIGLEALAADDTTVGATISIAASALAIGWMGWDRSEHGRGAFRILMNAGASPEMAAILMEHQGALSPGDQREGNMSGLMIPVEALAGIGQVAANMNAANPRRAGRSPSEAYEIAWDAIDQALLGIDDEWWWSSFTDDDHFATARGRWRGTREFLDAVYRERAKVGAAHAPGAVMGEA
jgi:hypothetical protein